MDELDAVASLIWALAGYPLSMAIASVSIGRSLLPPELIRWFATSGISATCRSRPGQNEVIHLGELARGKSASGAMLAGRTRAFFTGTARFKVIGSSSLIAETSSMRALAG